jgi:predicted transcriptional regulator of viral defense system
MGRNGAMQKAIAVFRKHSGTFRTKEAIARGIHPRTLYAMRDAGLIEQLARGHYRLSELPPFGNPDLVAIATAVPKGVVCLISALSFHEITTQIPHQVDIALQRQKAKRPMLKYPPLRVFWFSGQAFAEGVEVHQIDGATVRVYGPEKTVADCFKFRNKVGQDVALEALRLCRQRKHCKVENLLHFARICRVEKVMRPYLEALL